MRSPRVIISGGGTGGHVFPAIAIADAIMQQRPDADVLFVGAQGRMEMERVPKAGYRIEGLWISGFQRRLTLQNALFPVKLISSLMKAGKIVRRFKPHVAVGVGGYASGPLLRVAAAASVPCLIQEQNSFPGVTNRVLAPRVRTVCVAYPGMERWFPKEKIVLTGNPIRQQVTEIHGKRDEAAAHFGLNPAVPTLLVIGGSLGALTLNESMEAGLNRIAESGYQLIWQTGKAFAERARTAVNATGSGKVVTMPFIERMDYAYAMADAVVSRAGALSVSELCLVAKPVIFVPSPHVAEDHQTKNARALVQQKAALMIPDKDARTTLVTEVISLLRDSALKASLSSRIAGMALPDAARHIANEVLKLINEN